MLLKPATVFELHLTVVLLISLQHFRAVCDLVASQVSLVGTGKLAPRWLLYFVCFITCINSRYKSWHRLMRVDLSLSR